MGSPQSSFRRSNYRHHENSMLKLEPTTCFGTEKETLLQSSKSRFRRSGSDLSVKNMLRLPTKNCRPQIDHGDVLELKMMF